jgi:hypothetical protein
MKQKISRARELKKSIEILKQRQNEEEKLLHTQLLIVYESIKPYNVLKNAFRSLVTSPELKETVFESVSGVLTGYVSRKLLVRSSKNPFIRLAGLFVQYGVTNLVNNNSAGIKRTGNQLIDKLVDVFRVKNEKTE